MKLSYIKFLVVGLFFLTGLQEATLGSQVDEVMEEQARTSAEKKPDEKLVEVDIGSNMSGVCSILDRVCQSYSKQVFEQLAPSVFGLFSAFTLVLLIWNLCIQGLLKKKFDLGGAVKLLLSFSILAFFIKNNGIFLDYFYTPIKEATLGITKVVVSMVAGKGSSSQVGDLLGVVDQQFATIFAHARDLVAQSYFNFAAILNGIFIVIIYHLISCLFVFYVADLSFGLMAMTALAPLFLAGYLFEVTKGYSQAALRLVACTCLTTIFAGLSIGITLELTKHTIQQTSAIHTGGTWQYLCIGFLCLMFMRRAPQLASSITGASDSGTAAMTAGAMMTIVKTAASLGAGKVVVAAKALKMVSNGGSK